MNDDDLDRQWTPAARDRYAAAHAQLLSALDEHFTRTVAREGRRAEIMPGPVDEEKLREALTAFADAEFDWSGGTPFRLEGYDDEDDDFDEDFEVGDVVTVEYQGRLHVTDREALIAAGRTAYRRSWVRDTAADAEQAITGPAAALREVMHDQGFEFMAGLPHVEETEFQLRVYESRSDDPPPLIPFAG